MVFYVTFLNHKGIDIGQAQISLAILLFAIGNFGKLCQNLHIVANKVGNGLFDFLGVKFTCIGAQRGREFFDTSEEVLSFFIVHIVYTKLNVFGGQRTFLFTGVFGIVHQGHSLFHINDNGNENPVGDKTIHSLVSQVKVGFNGQGHIVFENAFHKFFLNDNLGNSTKAHITQGHLVVFAVAVVLVTVAVAV